MSTDQIVERLAGLAALSDDPVVHGASRTEPGGHPRPPTGVSATDRRAEEASLWQFWRRL
jgi:hypothetical protein